jgi:hypothetical protein
MARRRSRVPSGIRLEIGRPYAILEQLFLLGLVIAAGLGPAAGSRAALIGSNVVQVETEFGTITLASRVHDEAEGDPSRWLFEYELTGDYDPEPGATNGISSLQILFADLVFVGDHQAPPGWLVDCCLTASPFGAGFDLPDSAGFGVGPNGGAVFSFTAPAGTPFTDDPAGSFAGSHLADVPGDFVPLRDDASGRGPIVPIPEPGTAALLAVGLAALGRAASRRRALLP